jgi:hypothetical protein
MFFILAFLWRSVWDLTIFKKQVHVSGARQKLERIFLLVVFSHFREKQNVANGKIPLHYNLKGPSANYHYLQYEQGQNGNHSHFVLP